MIPPVVWLISGVVLISGGLAYWAVSTADECDRLRGEVSRLEAEASRQRLEAETRQRELAALTAQLGKLRQASRKGEDKINEKIKQGGDPCLNSRADADVLRLLRGTVSGGGD